MLSNCTVHKVMRELLEDELLAGCQHAAFKKYKDAHSNHILAFDTNWQRFCYFPTGSDSGWLGNSASLCCHTLTWMYPFSSNSSPSAQFTVSYILYYITHNILRSTLHQALKWSYITYDIHVVQYFFMFLNILPTILGTRTVEEPNLNSNII